MNTYEYQNLFYFILSVNLTDQAIDQIRGRGRRHKDDYCACFFCDARYNDARYQKFLGFKIKDYKEKDLKQHYAKNGNYFIEKEEEEEEIDNADDNYNDFQE